MLLNNCLGLLIIENPPGKLKSLVHIRFVYTVTAAETFHNTNCNMLDSSFPKSVFPNGRAYKFET